MTYYNSAKTSLGAISLVGLIAGFVLSAIAILGAVPIGVQIVGGALFQIGVIAGALRLIAGSITYDLDYQRRTREQERKVQNESGQQTIANPAAGAKLDDGRYVRKPRHWSDEA